jgi:hypothetical protein
MIQSYSAIWKFILNLSLKKAQYKLSYSIIVQTGSWTETWSSPRPLDPDPDPTKKIQFHKTGDEHIVAYVLVGIDCLAAS